MLLNADENADCGIMSVSSACAVDYPEVSRIFHSGEQINWIAFGSAGEYVVDTKTKLYASDHPITRKYEGGGGKVPLRCASFGCEGAWVCVEDDGEVRSRGLSANVQSALKKKAVRVSVCNSIFTNVGS